MFPVVLDICRGYKQKGYELEIKNILKCLVGRNGQRKYQKVAKQEWEWLAFVITMP